jgi:hypothetical protein
VVVEDTIVVEDTTLSIILSCRVVNKDQYVYQRIFKVSLSKIEGTFAALGTGHWALHYYRQPVRLRNLTMDEESAILTLSTTFVALWPQEAEGVWFLYSWVVGAKSNGAALHYHYSTMRLWYGTL